MKVKGFLSCLLLALLFSGCTTLEKERHVSVRSNPEYGAYLLARERLNRVRVGMSREAFFRLMQLRRLPGKEWYTAFSGGDGWLVVLSRKNQLPAGDLIEEYSFGYHEGLRVVERELVILRNGKVWELLEMPKPDEDLPSLPRELLNGELTRQEGNRLIRSYFARVHLTREAFARAEEALAKVRPGMTSGELRHHLGGYFYRLRHGYVYFADGFLWGPEFQSIETATGSLVLMPFGYVEDGKEVKRAVVKIVDGVISDIIRNQEKNARLAEEASG